MRIMGGSLGGSFTVDSAPGEGTTASLVFAVDKDC